MHKEPSINGASADQAAKKMNLRDVVIEQIRGLIKAENLRSGQRLPSERALSERFAVSRHLVREALRVLEQQGVIVSRIGSGSYVENPDASSRDSLLSEETLRERSNLMEILEFRRTLEPRIAYLAASRVTEENAAQLQRIIAAMREAMRAERLRDWHDGDAAFHSHLAIMTGNFLYEKTVSLLLQAMVTFRTSPLLNEQMRASQAAHESIAEYILAGNGQKAAETMEKHVVLAVRTALDSLVGV